MYRYICICPHVPARYILWGLGRKKGRYAVGTYAVGGGGYAVGRGSICSLAKEYSSTHPETHQKWLEIEFSHKKYRLAAPAAG